MISLPSLSSWSLKTKFALCSGALMFAFSAAFTAWALHTVESDLHAGVVEAQLTLVRATAEELDAKIDLRREALISLAGRFTQAASGSDAEMDAFFSPRPLFRKMFDLLVVVDAAGRVRFGAPARVQDQTIGPSLAGVDLLDRLRQGEPWVVSSPFKAAVDGQTWIAFAAPMRSAQGALTGALVGLINPARANFLGDLGRARIGKDGAYLLVERNEHPRFLIHPLADQVLAPAPGGKNHPIMAAALQGREGWVEGMSTLGVESLRTFKPLRTVPWVLVAAYPMDEAFAGLHARRAEALAVGGGLFMLASLAAWLVTLWLLRPLGRLRVQIGRHASDPGTAIVPESFGSAELAELVRAYNAQAASRREFEQRLQNSERHLHDIVDNMPASIAYVDRDQRYRFANARLQAQFKTADGRIVGCSLREVRGDEAYARMASQVDRALRGEVLSFESDEAIEGPGRSEQTHFIPDHDAQGQVRGFYKMSFDITALKRAQRSQALVEQRLRAITDHMPALIAHVDRDERYDFMNATFMTWLGIDPAASVGRKQAEVLAPEVYAARREVIARVQAGENSSFEMETQTRVGAKTLRIEYLADVAPDGSFAGFYTFSSDVTELKEAQRRLGELVRSDSLTGLHNRLQFEETLPVAIARCRRSRRGMALMYLDIDHFKQINDGFGHAVGDRLLQEFAQRLKRCVRSTDTICRLGGDEFVIILEGLQDEADARRVAQTLLGEVRRPIDLGDRLLELTTSLGIAFHAHDGDGEPPAAILARADAALYAAKAAGRNAFHLAGHAGPAGH